MKTPLPTTNTRLFATPAFGCIRALTGGDTPWFVARDVCRVLGYRQTGRALARHVAPGDMMKRHIIDTLGRYQLTWTINESGLYALILGSHLPAALEFKRWVTSEVLPALCRHGAYVTPQTMAEVDADPKALQAIIDGLKADNALQQTRLCAMQCQLDQAAPKIALADAVVDDPSAGISVSAMAKLLCQQGHTIGRNRLFAFLRRAGILNTQRRNYNEPKQWAVEQGLFRLCEVPGLRGRAAVPRITGKGQLYIAKLFAGQSR